MFSAAFPCFSRGFWGSVGVKNPWCLGLNTKERKIRVLNFLNAQARKTSTKIKFLGPETARWGGGLPREGVVAENFVPALETLSSLGFKERNPGCPGNFAGMSRTPGGVQKFVHVHFSFPSFGDQIFGA